MQTTDSVWINKRKTVDINVFKKQKKCPQHDIDVYISVCGYFLPVICRQLFVR